MELEIPKVQFCLKFVKKILSGDTCINLNIANIEFQNNGISIHNLKNVLFRCIV